ncbi:MAG: HAD-IC family P-type ATPase, partial [Lachnospiraceae bacterium]|nr:HAD-IC family P-type ATPase [Lachnospiraceae bacterium]
MKETYQKEKQELLQEYHSTTAGLSSEEVEVRFETYGSNELTGEKKKSVFLIFLEQFADFLVIILIVAATISAFLGDIESSIVIVAVITMNAILGTVQQIKAEQSLDSLKEMAMPTAKVIRDGDMIVISSKEVTVGDIVHLEAGDYVCADGRIIENASLKINESALTGESLSVEKEDRKIVEQVQIGDRTNMVFSGSFVTYGRGSFLVTGIGMNTEVGKIATLLKETENKRTPLQISLDNFGKKLAMAIIVICALLFGLSIFRGESIMHAFMFALALAVAAIPEALSSIVTIVLAFSTQKMVKENAIVRKLQAVEGLGSVSIICSDKTGTLTQNKMTVKQYYTSHNAITAHEFDLEDKLGRKLLYASSICNDSSNKGGVEIGDPTEVALIDFANKHHVKWEDIREEYNRLGEIPFDSERKLMSIAYQTEHYKNMVTKGAVDVIIHRIAKIETDDGIRDITEHDKELIKQANREFSENGLRVLAFATKKVNETELVLDDENQLTFLGLIAMMDPPREESKEAVSKCISAGIRPIMITGDHKITATAIAKEIGIMQEGMITIDGMELDNITDEELQDLVEKVSVYARVSPEHKIRIVRAWQAKGNIVSMTGDGVNDAPALKQADVGVAMGITGTEVAKDAASMVLADDNFATIVKAIETGRNVYNNIKKAIKFLLSGNMAGIMAVVYAGIVGLSAPFAPVHLLFINLLTDSLPAIALGLDSHTSAVMKEKPRPKNEGIMTKDFLLGILIEGT